MAIQEQTLYQLSTNTWKKIYETTLTDAATSVTISSLDGNTDEEYILICRFIDDDTTGGYYLRFNNDSGNNYGYQYIKGSSSTASALRDTSEAQIDLGYTNTDGNICFSKHLIHAKSGYVRTVISESAEDIATTTVTNIKSIGQVWNNTADNITSIVIGALNDKLNIGSRIILLKKASITGSGSGIKNIIAGTKKGSWERIYSTTLTDADAYTKLLLHCDESTLYDVTGKTVTLVGTAAMSTAQKKFGIGSCLLDGDSDCLTLADSDDWYFGTDNFTIDFWVRFISVAGDQVPIAQWWDFAGDLSFRVIFESGALHFYYSTDGTIIKDVSFGAFSVAINTWYHIAIVRDTVNLKVYVNGVQIGSTYNISTDPLYNSSRVLSIGARYGSSVVQFLNGYLDEIRISKGIARWTANFTPPTEPYTSKLTSLSINNLDGNTDILYRLRCRLINGYNGAASYYLRPNNDSDSDYGYQEVDGTDSTASAVRDTSEAQMHLGYAAAQNNLSISETIFYVKSGYLRTALTQLIKTITGTTCTSTNLKGQVYQDTATNITSLVILADQANGLGVGVVIELERLNL